jgi:hypothetical protein
MEVAWTTRNNDGPISMLAIKAKVRQAAKSQAAIKAGLYSIFEN